MAAERNSKGWRGKKCSTFSLIVIFLNEGPEWWRLATKRHTCPTQISRLYFLCYNTISLSRQSVSLQKTQPGLLNGELSNRGRPIAFTGGLCSRGESAHGGE